MRGSTISVEPQFGNLERMGIPRSVANLEVGHKMDSVYERYNVASKRDLDVAREKMERNAVERLYSTSDPHPNSHHFARDGQSLGKVEPVLLFRCSEPR